MSDGPSLHRFWPATGSVVIRQSATMRTYGKNFIYKKTVNYQQRQARLATEWDIRLDVSDALTVENIISNIKEQLDDLSFVLVSGVERPDNVAGGCLAPSNGSQPSWRPSPTTSTEHHVHLCLVLFVPRQRADVLKLVRGPRKMGDEYCAPRNAKFPYAGWVIHHAKPAYKLDGEPDIRFERGNLPMDPFTSDWALKIKSLMTKWGTSAMEQRFKGYLDLLRKNKIQEKIEQLQMSLEDNNAN